MTPSTDNGATLRLEVQYTIPREGLPAETEFRRWARAAIGARQPGAELLIRVTDESESAALNQRYRGKSGPTNVLSFPFCPPPPATSELLGDLVICAPVVAAQAAQQGKSPQAHWAHMVTHGVLHLLGYDHQQPAEAAEMEQREIEALARLGFPDPYQTITEHHD